MANPAAPPSTAPVYFAECLAHGGGGGWGVAASPEAALRKARSSVGETARTEHGSYVLEFAADAEPTCGNGMYGGWSAKSAPLRVVQRNKLPDDVTEAQLLASA